MKKLLPGILLLSLSGTALAQPQVNTLPAVGDSVNIFEFEANGWTGPGPSGANVTWDFSGITLNPVPNFVVKIKPASQAQQFAKYPGAELAGEMWMTGIPVSVGNMYLDVTGNQVSAMGEHTNFGDDYSIYTNPESDMPLPLTYLQTYTDTYREVEYYDTDSTVSTGTKTFLVDGYGTLLLPGGSLQNVLRVKVIEQKQEIEYTDGQPETTNSTDTSYDWRVQGFAYEVLHVNVNGNDRSGQVSWQTPMTGISEANLPSLRFYPNPVAEMLYLEGVENASLQIFDLSGRVLLSTQVEGNGKVSLKDLQPGIYLLQVTTPAGFRTERLVKN